MKFSATRSVVANRGKPPASFLEELVEWGSTAPGEIFAPNPNPDDIYALIKPVLASLVGHDEKGAPIYKWDGPMHRRAAMLEVMRVHAGFESSWNWNEGVDRTNATSLHKINGQETGVFQVSFDSTFLDHRAMQPFAIRSGVNTPQSFIALMKEEHALAMEYYARLVRVSIQWAGPLKNGIILKWLSKDAMDEFETLLTA